MACSTCPWHAARLTSGLAVQGKCRGSTYRPTDISSSPRSNRIERKHVEPKEFCPLQRLFPWTRDAIRVSRPREGLHFVDEGRDPSVSATERLHGVDEGRDKSVQATEKLYCVDEDVIRVSRPREGLHFVVLLQICCKKIRVIYWFSVDYPCFIQ